MAFGDLIQSGARQSTSGGSSDLAFPSSVTSGNLLVAFITIDAVTNPSTTGVTDTQSNSYTKIGAYATPQQVELWYTIAGSTGSCTQTATRSGTGSLIIHSCSEFEGPFSSSTLLGDSSTNTGTGTSTSTGSVTPDRAGSLAVGYISADGALSQTSSWTEIENTVELSPSQYSLVNGYKLQPTISADDFTATQNVTQVWGAVAASFNPAVIVLSASTGSYTLTGVATSLSRSTRAGHIYRVDVGTTFDNETITSYVTLPWQQAPNPQTHDKVAQWLDVTVYLKGTATVNIDARFADEPHEFAAASFITYGTIGATPDGDKGFVYLGVTSRWMQLRFRATDLSFEVLVPVVVGYNSTTRRV